MYGNMSHKLELERSDYHIVLGRRGECWKDWANTGGSWNGGLHSLWLMAGLHQNLQVSYSRYAHGTLSKDTSILKDGITVDTRMVHG